MNSAGLAEFIRLNLRLYDVVSPAARSLCIATTCSNYCRNSFCINDRIFFSFSFSPHFLLHLVSVAATRAPAKKRRRVGPVPMAVQLNHQRKRDKKTGAISLYVVFLLCNSKREKKRRERRRRITRKKKIQKTGRGPHVRRQIFFRYQQAKSSGTFW